METLLIAILGIAVNNPMHMVHRLLILLDQVRFFDDMYSKSFTERLHGRLKSRFENWLELQRNFWIITLSSCWTSKKKKVNKKEQKLWRLAWADTKYRVTILNAHDVHYLRDMAYPRSPMRLLPQTSVIVVPLTSSHLFYTRQNNIWRHQKIYFSL